MKVPAELLINQPCNSPDGLSARARDAIPLLPSQKRGSQRKLGWIERMNNIIVRELGKRMLKLLRHLTSPTHEAFIESQQHGPDEHG